ncbi:MAG TPA: hypothetical protein VIJ62_12010 [Rhizomicrobium sp.]
MLTNNNARLCPVSGMSCLNSACRQFGCVTVGEPQGASGPVHTMPTPTSEPRQENARN